MNERRFSDRGRILRTAALGLVIAACGSRTGLLLPGDGFVDSDGGGGDGALADGNPGFDGSPPDFDAPIDIDALPPIDGSRPDVQPPNDCPDADATLVYVLSSNYVLYSFFPPTLQFKTIGKIVCPAGAGQTPYSMAVDRKGKAYSVFTDGSLFQLSTATAACAPTGYQAGQLGWTTFGMGFSGDTTSESLYVAEGNQNNMGPSQGLGIIDTTTFKLTKVGSFNAPIARCELTGTGDGRLFAFCVPIMGSGGVIAQIDPKNANVIAQNQLKVGTSSDAFAYAFWGNSFWIFTSGGTTTVVTQYDLDTLTEQNVTTLDDVIVGAGVSTCAPL